MVVAGAKGEVGDGTSGGAARVSRVGVDNFPALLFHLLARTTVCSGSNFCLHAAGEKKI